MPVADPKPKKLRDIAITYPQDKADSDTPDRNHYRLHLKADALTEFLTVKARQAKVETEVLKAVYLIPVIAARARVPEFRANYLLLPTVIDWDGYDAVAEDEQAFGDFICDFYTRGLASIPSEYGINEVPFSSWINAFRATNFRIESVIKTRNFRAEKLRAQLSYVKDFNSFRLNLRVDRGADVLFDAVILETQSDPGFYHHQFCRDIQLSDGKITIDRRFNQGGLFELDIAP